MEKDKSTFKLPDGWIWATIGEVGVLSSGDTPYARGRHTTLS